MIYYVTTNDLKIGKQDVRGSFPVLKERNTEEIEHHNLCNPLTLYHCELASSSSTSSAEWLGYQLKQSDPN